MRLILAIVACGLLFSFVDSEAREGGKVKYRPLTPEEEKVIIHRGTEPPFTGKYYHFKGEGTYLCKRCGAPLFRSESKFDSGTGWPSFDEAIPGAVAKRPDPDGVRTEIVCARCGAHLGHVFFSEGFTAKNVRHCVNSISLVFEPSGSKGEGQAEEAEAEGSGRETPAGSAMGGSGRSVSKEGAEKRDDPTGGEARQARAYFAGGCFWGVEYYLSRAEGVIATRVGFMGGHVPHPTYEQVCTGTTGHVETVEVVYNPSRTDYRKLARLFFEIHDPTQVDRQGPDVGEQYRSVVFYVNDEQKKVAEELIGELEKKGFQVATRLEKAGPFYEAEEYHQRYYEKTGKLPYCHRYTKRF